MTAENTGLPHLRNIGGPFRKQRGRPLQYALISVPAGDQPRQARSSGEEGRAKEAKAAPAGDERLEVLNALLSNPEFRASERNKRFLKFVVEEAVAGRSDRIKAFTIAVDVFGRDADFDASLDPIVRIAAGQLRKSLRDYYEGPGRADPIRITLPLGAYVPAFEKKRPFIVEQWSQLRKTGSRWGWSVAAFAVVVAAASVTVTGILLSTSVAKRQAVSPRPVIVLDSARSNPDDPETRSLARSLTESLWVRMGRHDTVRVVGVRPEEELGAIVERTRERFGDGSRFFKLLTSVQREGGEMRVFWHLVDGTSRETYLSSTTSEAIAPESANRIMETVAGKVADSLFGDDGIIVDRAEKAKVIASDLSG